MKDKKYLSHYIRAETDFFGTNLFKPFLNHFLTKTCNINYLLTLIYILSFYLVRTFFKPIEIMFIKRETRKTSRTLNREAFRAHFFTSTLKCLHT